MWHEQDADGFGDWVAVLGSAVCRADTKTTYRDAQGRIRATKRCRSERLFDRSKCTRISLMCRLWRAKRCHGTDILEQDKIILFQNGIIADCDLASQTAVKIYMFGC